MKRLALAALLLSLLATGVPAAFGQACSTPPPTATPPPTYRDLVLSTNGSHLVVYYPLHETSGTVATDYSGNGGNGVYGGVNLNQVTFPDGSPAGAWDGINDFVDIYNSYLAAHFDGNSGTILIWAQNNAGFWTDNATRTLVRIGGGANDSISIRKAPNNTMGYIRLGGAVNKQNTQTLSPTVWSLYVITWDTTSDTQVAYFQGTPVGSPLSGLGTWTTSIASTTADLGAINNSGTSPFVGNLAEMAIWNAPLTGTEVALLNTVPAPYTPPPTATVCPTYTPSNTPTASPTFTPTPSNTPDLYIFITLPPAETTGTPGPGQDAVFVKSMTAGQAGIALIDGAILFSLFGFFIVFLLLRGSGGGRG